MDINLDNPGYGNDPSIFDGIVFKSKYGDVPACCTDFTRTFIKNYLNNISDGVFVEIGVFGGSTLLDIYDICIKNKICIYGIDPWDKINIFNGHTINEISESMKLKAIDSFKCIKNNLINIININSLNINLINEESWKVFNNFNNNSIDCIHIDGDHSYDGVKQDMNLYFNKIKNGGIIINDDYHWGGVKKAIDEFVFNNKHNIIYTHTIQNGEKHVIIKK